MRYLLKGTWKLEILIEKIEFVFKSTLKVNLHCENCSILYKKTHFEIIYIYRDGAKIFNKGFKIYTNR